MDDYDTILYFIGKEAHLYFMNFSFKIFYNITIDSSIRVFSSIVMKF